MSHALRKQSHCTGDAPDTFRHREGCLPGQHVQLYADLAPFLELPHKIGFAPSLLRRRMNAGGDQRRLVRAPGADSGQGGIPVKRERPQGLATRNKSRRAGHETSQLVTLILEAL